MAVRHDRAGGASQATPTKAGEISNELDPVDEPGGGGSLKFGGLSLAALAAFVTGANQFKVAGLFQIAEPGF